ncbi:hypothetical protein RB174 [Rhodopirellula baltica SH 1]|uniref:Uncharacterized protein n=1 Tax=Rhodopirellula baltica (strain DSM 10527 / NCIMB 13988 / SH1) TaxID=243090 RepID=Q7UZ57_RHOBA|nr:hypothetical protein RB174 [Rhodopirellula baltica SH 1]
MDLQFLDALQFENDGALHQQIDPIATIQRHVFVANRLRLLELKQN